MKSVLKSIERFIRNQFKKYLSSGVEPEYVDGYFLQDKYKINKILLLRQDRLGDLIVSTHFFELLKNELPNAKIDILLGKNNKTAKIGVSNYFTNILILEKTISSFISIILQIRKFKYDLVIDLFDNASATSSLILKLSKAKLLLGLDKENRNSYTHLISMPDKRTTHHTLRISSIIRAFSNIDYSNFKYYYKIATYDKLKNKLNLDKSKKVLGINLSGSTLDKYWGTENFIKLINHIKLKFNLNIILISTKELNDTKNEIISNTKVESSPELDSFDEYVFLVSQLDYLLTPDTSAVHIAGIYNIPIIALYHELDINIHGKIWEPISDKKLVFKSPKGIKHISCEEVIRNLDDLFIDS